MDRSIFCLAVSVSFRSFAAALLGVVAALGPVACTEVAETAVANAVGPLPADLLPSWRPGGVEAQIRAFVERTTDPASPDFLPKAERIAVFDNDGTLWVEKPVYAQLLFAIDRVRALAPEHPEWQEIEPFRSVLAGDWSSVAAGGEHAIAELVAATHAGMTTEAFDRTVREWLASARHPRLDRPYTECVYAPMLELLEHLRANGYRTFIVTGGGVEFVRAFAEEVYGVPPEQVVGSSAVVAFERGDEGPVLVKQPKIGFIDDKAGKPAAIHLHIGRRPAIAFGNSDGDLEMLEWTSGRAGPSLAAIVRHDDAEREWAYDRDSPVGRLDAALSAAAEHGWTVVSMRDEWTRVFPHEPFPNEAR